MTPRLFPDIPAEREALLMQRMALSHRVRALIEHHDILEANGHEANFVRIEICRATAALGAVEVRLQQGDDQ